MEANKILYALNRRVKELNSDIRCFSELNQRIIQLTGYDLWQLETLFAAGYTLQPPKEPVSMLVLLKE